MPDKTSGIKPYEMLFDIGTIKHLGLQMYSTLPPVIGELVSNAWDADAEKIEITIPEDQLTDKSEIVFEDNGSGMADEDIRLSYLIIGRDRRKNGGDKPTPKHSRIIMGRKGIGKFSAFGIANQIEIETFKDGQTSRFLMDYEQFEKNAEKRQIEMPPLPPTGTLKKGTRITLRNMRKFRNRKIDIQNLRRGLARRFSVIGPKFKFEVRINGKIITPQERDLKLLLDADATGSKYLWEYDKVEVKEGTGWVVSGWIGALNRTKEIADGIQRGIVIMARGKLVQEPFVFEAVVGQQYALSYLVGELDAEFVDSKTEDSISTTRNSLVWDTEANQAFLHWGQTEVNRVAREWGNRRKADNEKELQGNSLYKKFLAESDRFDDSNVKRVADKLIRQVVTSNPLKGVVEQEPVIQMCLDFMEYDSFQELARELSDVSTSNIEDIMRLFREWEIVEAKEMMRVTEGRITTINKFQSLIDANALEVPTLHNFLKEFPWVLDPRWTLIADEKRYSELLKKQFPDKDKPEDERRIDFLCVSESTNLIVVEIKRPKSKASNKELNQIEEYVNFMRAYARKTSDLAFKHQDVVGYLLVGDHVNTDSVREKMKNLSDARIFVRRYSDLLKMVESNHKEFLKRYSELRLSSKKLAERTDKAQVALQIADVSRRKRLNA